MNVMRYSFNKWNLGTLYTCKIHCCKQYISIHATYNQQRNQQVIVGESGRDWCKTPIKWPVEIWSTSAANPAPKSQSMPPTRPSSSPPPKQTFCWIRSNTFMLKVTLSLVVTLLVCVIITPFYFRWLIWWIVFLLLLIIMINLLPGTITAPRTTVKRPNGNAVKYTVTIMMWYQEVPVVEVHEQVYILKTGME